MSQLKSRIRAEDYALHLPLEPLQDAVERHPGASAMAAFGLGLVVGVGIGLALHGAGAARREPQGLAERLGQRVLESLHQWMPQS